MKSYQRVILWSLLVFGLMRCRNVWANISHREEQFVKLQGGFPTATPIKSLTAIALAFCSVECTMLLACRSFAFLTTSSTNNCHLSSTAEGTIPEGVVTDFVVYKKDDSKALRGCASNPCLNGGTCEELFGKPYVICHCPSAAQGVFCEYSLACFNADWGLGFDERGTQTCGGITNYMVGFKRSDCTELNCIEEAICCPVDIKYSKSSMSCNNGWWWNSFATDAWNWCPAGYILRGFFREGGSQELGWLEEGVCCKPDDSPAQHSSDCYNEDIGLSFDHNWATARCWRPQYYLVAIRTSHCGSISCIEELRCCRMD